MKRTIIYIENSVFGFYYDDKPENISKARATRILFDQIKAGMFDAVTSPLTVKELSAAPEPARNKLIILIRDFDISVVNVDENELETLVSEYMAEGIVPDEYINDARHVAYATILRVEMLVSLNLHHIANEWSARRFNAVNQKKGYSPLIVRTTEEVIHYGN
jgi:hypothetical protein